MTAEEFMLKWNDHQLNLVSIFSELYSEQQLVNITLACEDRVFQAHKVVLSACSPYFRDLLTKNPCKHPIIFLKDVKGAWVEALLQFMYKGEVSVKQEDLMSLVHTASSLQVKGLTDIPCPEQPKKLHSKTHTQTSAECTHSEENPLIKKQKQNLQDNRVSAVNDPDSIQCDTADDSGCQSSVCSQNTASEQPVFHPIVTSDKAEEEVQYPTAAYGMDSISSDSSANRGSPTYSCSQGVPVTHCSPRKQALGVKQEEADVDSSQKQGRRNQVVKIEVPVQPVEHEDLEEDRHRWQLSVQMSSMEELSPVSRVVHQLAGPSHSAHEVIEDSTSACVYPTMSTHAHSPWFLPYPVKNTNLLSGSPVSLHRAILLHPGVYVVYRNVVRRLHQHKGMAAAVRAAAAELEYEGVGRCSNRGRSKIFVKYPPCEMLGGKLLKYGISVKDYQTRYEDTDICVTESLHSKILQM